MIILPDRKISHTKVFLPMRRVEWLPPSVSQEKNAFGHETEKRWHIRARLSDGCVRWHGVFRDREDCDAFLWAIATGTLNQQPHLWGLPTPVYFPEYGDGAKFLFAASITITSSGSQSVPADWDNNANTIWGIGSGGSGANNCKQDSIRVTGGSGAEIRILTNYSASGTFTYTVDATGGAAVARTTTGTTAGNNGTDTVLNTNALIATKGLGGTVGNPVTPPNGGSGGTGGTGYSGGAGGTCGNNDSATGGGGAGGTTANGSNGAATTGTNQGTAGGNGGATNGGTGGAGSAVNASTPSTATNGGAGTGINGSLGAGGGGGGAAQRGTGTVTGGSGGNYGAGGGGSNGRSSSGNSTSGAGGPGLIYMDYTPLVVGNSSVNIAMIGM